MDMRTPLAKVKHLGSAKFGTEHFIAQRVSAIFMALLMIWFVTSVISFLIMPSRDIQWFITSPWNITLAIIFIGMFLYHGSLGIQVIIEDYIKHKFTQMFLLILIKGLCIFSAVAGIVAVFSIHFFYRLIG
jgi:succinate dehydrogenase / fumarate reductase membrane anchor subunit